MSHSFHSTSAFFEAMYRNDADPWNFEHSEYERNRYNAIVQALEGRRWKAALEPGCSVGVLTEGLAPLCDYLLALDFSETAVNAAKERCQRFTQVEVRCLGLEEAGSFANFDLIVLSEIGYYFTKGKWQDLSARIVAEMQPHSTLLAAHWTGHSEDHETSGDSVHETLLGHPDLKLKHSERHAGFRLERWERS